MFGLATLHCTSGPYSDCYLRRMRWLVRKGNYCVHPALERPNIPKVYSTQFKYTPWRLSTVRPKLEKDWRTSEFEFSFSVLSIQVLYNLEAQFWRLKNLKLENTLKLGGFGVEALVHIPSTGRRDRLESHGSLKVCNLAQTQCLKAPC